MRTYVARNSFHNTETADNDGREVVIDFCGCCGGPAEQRCCWFIPAWTARGLTFPDIGGVYCLTHHLPSITGIRTTP